MMTSMFNGMPDEGADTSVADSLGTPQRIGASRQMQAWKLPGIRMRCG
jgi:hypothetical protein